jgi:hypothetical protein
MKFANENLHIPILSQIKKGKKGSLKGPNDLKNTTGIQKISNLSFFPDSAK